MLPAYPYEMMLAIDILQFEHLAPEEWCIAARQLNILVTQLQHANALIMWRWQLQLGPLHQDHGTIGTKGSCRIGQSAGTHRTVWGILCVIHVQQAHRVVLKETQRRKEKKKTKHEANRKQG